MAVPTAGTVVTGTLHATALVSVAADADTGEVLITHGLGGTPDIVWIEPLLAAAVLDDWFVSTKSSTQVGITKNGTAMSSAGADQIRIHAIRLHSLIQ